MQQYLKISTESEEVTYFDNVYTDIDMLLKDINRKTRKKHKIEYYDIPVCFDIETSSFYHKGEKAACMYIWMFSIGGNIIIGRCWDEFIYLLTTLKDKLSLHVKFRRLICYVHSLGYEFQWICKRIKWEKVFALDKRVPLTALSEHGIEFRCSYKLSGYRLEKVGENLKHHDIKKMTGDLDYKKLRLPKDPETGFEGTPLTDEELGYCINDVRVLSAYIEETIETEGGITKIPLTKTGYVRRYCREHIYGSKASKNSYVRYRKFMEHLTLDPEEFKMLLRAFQGGFTHASCFYSNKEEPLENCISFDYTSKYPSALVAEMYPMGKGEFYDPKDSKDLKYQLSHYCCVFDVRFEGLEPIIFYENYISASKCFTLVKPVLNNGRVVRAEVLETTITNVDLDIIKKCYSYKHIYIGKFIRYEKKYLPTDFVNCVLDFYESKTTLKDVEGKEEEYMQSKEMLNSCYGAAVTNPCKSIITYISGETEDVKTEDLGWVERQQILEEQIDKYNKSKDRFLFYPWGIFCTAYCRRDLFFHGILKLGSDYIYSDTDSVKFIGNHEGFEKEYNVLILKKLLKACRYHNIDISRVAPKTIEGKIKPLGVWDFDGHFTIKTLGAKRYMVHYDDDPRNPEKKKGKYAVTVAGLNKKKGTEYLSRFKDPFKHFNEDLTVPKEYSGRQAATYIDHEISGTCTDYLGNTGSFHELSSLHLEETEYNMSLADIYVNYLLEIQECYEI